MKQLLVLAFLSLIIGSSLAVPVFSHAQSNDLRLQVPLTDPSKSKPTETIKLCDTDPTKPGAEIKCNGISQYIAAAYVWIIGAVGILVVLVFMYGGVLYLISAGDSGKIQQAQTAMSNALVGLALTLGSYTVLWIINPEFVQLKPITLGGLNQPKLSVNITAPAPTPSSGGASGGATSSGPTVACGTSTSVVTGNISDPAITYLGPDGFVWISGAFKNGDQADVIYYFHGATGVPDYYDTVAVQGVQDKTWTYASRNIPAILQQKITSGAMGPVILVAPLFPNSVAGAENLLQKALGAKGLSLSIKSKSITGHSGGGYVIGSILPNASSYKYIGMIDPSADTIVTQEAALKANASRISLIYRPANWGGQYAGNATALEKLATIIPSQSKLVEKDHNALILDSFQNIDACFKK